MAGFDREGAVPPGGVEGNRGGGAAILCYIGAINLRITWNAIGIVGGGDHGSLLVWNRILRGLFRRPPLLSCCVVGQPH